VVAYEAGSRWIAHPRLSLDVAAYYNRYDNLRTVTQGAPSLEIAGGVPYLAVPLAFGNEGSGESRGFEVVADWRLHPRAKLEAGYSFERLEIFSVNDQLGHEGLMWQGTTPQSIAFLKSSTDLVGPARLDANLRYVGRLEHLVVQSGPPTGEIPAYLALDLRLGIDVSRTLHAFAGGRNLLAGRHGEFMDEVLSPPNAFQVGEEYYAGLRIRL
jgi:iron complex outermembrane receptor protein